MKRNIFLISMMAALIITGCDKTSVSNHNRPASDNYATIGKSSSKESGKPIEITYSVGHDISECNGCIYINGELGHADCQGGGNACLVRIRIWPIGGQPKGETFNVVVDTVWGLTTEDFFNMPNRSLTVLDATSENQAYLNIPAQLVYRDSVTHQFTFTGLFYSDKAAYCNN